MRAICLVVLLAGCATEKIEYSRSCHGSHEGNAVVMAMGDPITDEEFKKLNLPTPEGKFCR